VFTIATTGYILIAVRFEERDLIDHFGKTYSDYREQVPMLIPTGRKQNQDGAFIQR
jgi:protein-S-isoprenylcysteine O-methyltransferase Ste14